MDTGLDLACQEAAGRVFGRVLNRTDPFPILRMSYPWFLISAHILHIIPIFILHFSFSSTTLPSSQEYNVKSSLSISPCHDHELTLSTAYTDYSIHRVQHTLRTAYNEYSIHPVQHTPSTAYTQYSIHWGEHPPKIVYLPFILMVKSWLMNVAWASGMPPYTIHHSQPGLPESSKVKSSCHVPTGARWLTDIYSLSTQRAVHRPTPSTHPISLDHGLQVDLQTQSLAASRCIFKLTRSRLPSVSLNFHDYGLQVRTIMASKCISPNSLDYSLQVHLPTRSTAASKFAW